MSQAASFSARAFGLAAVYDVPEGMVIGHLAPDSVHQVRESGGWFVMEHGYVAKTEMQPMGIPIKASVETKPKTPFWAELIAPSSVVRGFASGRAPIVDKLGYGAVLRVVSTLDEWYEIEGGGWVVGEHLSAWASSPRLNERSLLKWTPEIQVNLRAMMLRMYTGKRLIVQSPFYGGKGVEQGATVLRSVQPGGERGAPWQMITESGIRVYGAYWHNRFGLAGDEADLQLPPETAKIIYASVTNMPSTVRVD